jgi:xanthine dehydrogenase accessory factor
MTVGLSVRVLELAAGRVPFVHATVVRAQVPSSAKAGDDAIVHSDGSIEGFVGGQCAETSVRTAALGALRDGKTVLLRVLPDDAEPFPDSPGAQIVVNPCLSGGALEIFLQPMLPAPLVEVVGTTPVADAVIAFAELLGYATARWLPGQPPSRADAVIIASHGRDEEPAIRAALAAGVPHIALVASRRRGSAVLDELGLPADQQARVKTPAGLDIGARTAKEVALSILAEVVSMLRGRAGAQAPADLSTPPSIAIDPVCGMTVTIQPDTPHVVIDGVDIWFCNPSCRDRYAAADPGA